MAETTVAESSPAEATDVFGGKEVSMAEFSTYRQSGELPARFKPETADSGTDDAPEKTADDSESAPDSDPDNQEQPPKGKVKSQTAEQRIAQLESTIEKIRKGAGLERKTEVAPVSQPTPQPQQFTRAKPTPEGNGPDGKPYASYEDYVFDAGRWAAEQVQAEWERKEAEKQAQQRATQLRSEAEETYPDFEAVAAPAADKIMGLINNPNVDGMLKRTLLGPDGFHILYALGKDEALIAKFEKLAISDPAEAIYVWKGLKAEVSKVTATDADDAKGGKAPETKKTSAPKPPTPVSGASSRAFDVSDDSLSPEEWARKRNQQLAKRG